MGTSTRHRLCSISDMHTKLVRTTMVLVELAGAALLIGLLAALAIRLPVG
jgi:hypothetical protein